jgi:integrase/recombinase XerD
MKANNFPEISEFLAFLAVERRLSSNTIISYQNDLGKFEDFLLNQKISLLTFSTSDLTMLVSKENKAGLSPSSLSHLISTIRSFYQFLIRKKSFPIGNPAKGFQAPKKPLRLPKALPIGEIEKILSAAHRISNPHRERDYAVMELLYASGARTSEIVSLNLSDFTKSNNNPGLFLIKLFGKGSKERIVPIGEKTKMILDQYLNNERGKYPPKRGMEQAVFLSGRGARISRQVIDKAIKEACEAAGVEPISAHTFRHSFATHLLDGGAEIRAVQELLGHASVTTTQIYTAVTLDKLRENYAMAHPRAK